jgi:hypothetical protein
MKCIALIAGLGLFLSAAGSALADTRYDIVAVDDVNGYSTFAGSMTTTAPFSLAYDFSIVDFDLQYLTKSVTYSSANSNVVIERQGFLFNAKDGSSSFELTFYPDASYYSELFVPGQDSYGDSGYFAFVEVAAVPEPASAALALAGLGVLGWCARRRSSVIASTPMA